MIIDTHTHPYLPNFDSDREEIMSRAAEAGVSHIILPNVDLSTIAPMRSLHSLYPSTTFMAMGLHPTEVGESWRDDMAMIDEEWARNRSDYIAVGEVGVDLYWDKTFREAQMQVFEMQARRAAESDLPLIIHCREALDCTLEVLQGLERKPQAVFHSFGGTPRDVDRVRATGDFYFGINGVVTFKNARLDNTVCEIGAERLLLETDAPYLAPVPHRGRRNEPAYIVDTRDRVALALGIAPSEVEDATTASAKSLFRLPV